MKPRTRSTPARTSSRGGVTAARPTRAKRAPARLKASASRKSAGERSVPVKIKATGRGKPARAKPAHRKRVTAKSARRGKATARGPASPRAAEPGVFTLNADCTLTEAESLQAALLDLLAEPQPVTLDAAQVQRIDTAALQLLAAFVRDRRLAGRATDWRSTAPVLAPAAQLLDLSGVLGLAGDPR